MRTKQALRCCLPAMLHAGRCSSSCRSSDQTCTGSCWICNGASKRMVMTNTDKVMMISDKVMMMHRSSHVQSFVCLLQHTCLSDGAA